MINKIEIAKKYLNQNLKLDELYRSKMKQLSELKEMLSGISSVMGGGEKLQSTKKLDPLGDNICKIIDLENDINEICDEYLNKKADIINKIEKIEDQKLKLLLSLRYLNFMTFEHIAYEMDISFQWTCKLHKRALKLFYDKYMN